MITSDAQPTIFGSLKDYEKGGVQIIDDDAKRYVFSNVFDVAATNAAYERIAVGKNFEYVIEAARAEGESPWYCANHDEFVTCMDGAIRVDLRKLADDHTYIDTETDGAHQLATEPNGQVMGYFILRRGHMGLLPVGSAYRFSAPKASVMIIQTIDGPVTQHKWDTICQQV